MADVCSLRSKRYIPKNFVSFKEVMELVNIQLCIYENEAKLRTHYLISKRISLIHEELFSVTGPFGSLDRRNLKHTRRGTEFVPVPDSTSRTRQGTMKVLLAQGRWAHDDQFGVWISALQCLRTPPPINQNHVQIGTKGLWIGSNLPPGVTHDSKRDIAAPRSKQF